MAVGGGGGAATAAAQGGRTSQRSTVDSNQWSAQDEKLHDDLELDMDDIYRQQQEASRRRKMHVTRYLRPVLEAVLRYGIPVTLVGFLFVALLLALNLRSTIGTDARDHAWYTVRAPMIAVPRLAISMWGNLEALTLDVPGIKTSVVLSLSMVSPKGSKLGTKLQSLLDWAVAAAFVFLVLGALARFLSWHMRKSPNRPWMQRAARAVIGGGALILGVYMEWVGVIEFPEVMAQDLNTNPQKDSLLAFINANKIQIDYTGHAVIKDPDNTTVITASGTYRRFFALCVIYIAFGAALLLGVLAVKPFDPRDAIEEEEQERAQSLAVGMKILQGADAAPAAATGSGASTQEEEVVEQQQQGGEGRTPATTTRREKEKMTVSPAIAAGMGNAAKVNINMKGKGGGGAPNRK